MTDQSLISLKRHQFITRKRLLNSPRASVGDNIFQLNKFIHSQTDPVQDLNLNLYHIVGDRDFKAKHLMDKTINSKTLSNISHIPVSYTQTTSAIPAAQSSRLTLKNQSRLIQLSQLNYLDRDEKTFDSFAKYTNQWNKFQNISHHKSKRKNTTITKLRAHIEDNPQREDLIKQQGLQYWQMSLRNNNRELLKHLNSVPLNTRDILGHLQTTKGQTFLERSIPKIPRNTSDGFALISRGRILKSKSTLDNIPQINSHTVQEVYCSNWQNKDLSRVYQQFSNPA